MKLKILYPINLPVDFKKTERKSKYKNYKVTLRRALSTIRKNIDLLNLTNCRLYTNSIIENDRFVEHLEDRSSAAILYFNMRGMNFYLASDRYFTTTENIFCIAQALSGYALIYKNCKAMEYEYIKN